MKPSSASTLRRVNPRALQARLEALFQLVSGDLAALVEPFRAAKAFQKPQFDEATRTFVDCPTYRGFPLGGIGNGGISLFADGGFSEARLNHSWYVPARDLRGSFFAVRTRRADGRTCAKLLRRTHHHSRELGVPNVAHTRFRGQVPSFELDFTDDELPVQLSLRGFSPLIAQNLKDSSLPTALFTLSAHNPTPEPADVSLVFSWQNVLGITGTGGSALIAQHTFRCDYSQHGFAEVPEGQTAAIKLGIALDFEPEDPRRRGIGEHMISTDPAHDVHISHCLRWDERAEVPGFWQTFEQQGHVDGTTGKSGRSVALCVSFRLLPGEKREVPFQLSWFMPHFVLEKNARWKLLTGKHDGTDHGLYASNFFGSVDDLDAYVRAERERLWNETMALPRLLLDGARSNLPAWLVDTMLNATDSVWTNTVLTKKGELYTLEAVDWRLRQPVSNSEWPFGALTGTNDQRLSAHPFTATFFPELDLTELEAFRRLTRDGKVPHGNGGAEIALGDVDTPYSAPIAWLNAGHTDWPDLTCSWILQFGKWVKTTGKRELVDARWSDLLAMSGYLNRLVVDGVPEGASTYDIFVYEPCFLYTVTLFIATNEMLADLAQLVTPACDPDAPAEAKIFSARAAEARSTLDRRLWNAERGYYRVCEGKETLFQGGLAGDWISRYAGLAPAVPFEQARSHSAHQHEALVKSAVRAGSLPSAFGGRPLPYNEATPEGEPVILKMFNLIPKPAFNYIYQTVSYQALESVYLGRVAEGLDTICMIYDKAYAEGYPWDMNLLGLPGFVYMTHPVMWATLNALSGAALDLTKGELTLAPKTLPDRHELRVPVFFPRVWFALRYDTRTRQGELEVLRRFDETKLTLSRLVLRDEHDQAHTMLLNAEALTVGAILRFTLPLTPARDDDARA